VTTKDSSLASTTVNLARSAAHSDAPCPPLTSHGASIAHPRLTIELKIGYQPPITGAGGDHGIDRHENWLRSLCVLRFSRPQYISTRTRIDRVHLLSTVGRRSRTHDDETRRNVGESQPRIPHHERHHCNVIEAPWLVNGGHGASLRQHQMMKYRAPRALQHPPRHRRVPGLEAVANRGRRGRGRPPPPRGRLRHQQVSLMLRIDAVTAISPSASAHSIFGSDRETWLHTEAVCTPPPPAAALAAATAAALGRPPPSPPARPIPKIDYQSHPELGARRVPTHTEAPWLVNGGHGASLRHHKVGRARSPPPSAGAPTSC
jgi:hypothetical protein